MSNVKISQLNNASTPLAGTEVVPIVQSGSTKKVSLANIATYSNSVDILYTIELIAALTVDFYAPYNMKINSVTNITNSPTTTLIVNGGSYVLGNNITAGQRITVTVNTIGVVNLNITKV